MQFCFINPSNVHVEYNFRISFLLFNDATLTVERRRNLLTIAKYTSSFA